MILKILILVAVAIILVHCAYVISKLNHRSWHGHQVAFAGLALSYGFFVGGTVSIMLGWPPGPVILLFGLAGRVLFDRRNRT